MMRGIHYDSPETAVIAFFDLGLGFPVLMWSIYFKKGCQRMQLCIDADGEYFEKM